MALAAITATRRADTDPQRTFGLYRLEVLAALANAVLLGGVAVYVLVEAVRRFGEPPEVLAGPMLAVAVLGLLANIVAFAPAAYRGAGEHQPARRVPGGARRPARLARRDRRGAVIAVTDWWWADPLVAVAIGAVHPAPHLAAGPGRGAHPGAGRPGAPPGDRRARPAGRGARRRRGARPARLDAHLRHGGGLGPPAPWRRTPRSARCWPPRGRPCTRTSTSSTPPCRSSPEPHRRGVRCRSSW